MANRQKVVTGIETIRCQVQETIAEPWADVLFVRNDGNVIMSCALNGFSGGERNSGMSRVAGSLFSRGFYHGDVAGFLKIVNQRNRPPLTSQEVHQIAASVWRTHQRGKEA